MTNFAEWNRRGDGSEPLPLSLSSTPQFAVRGPDGTLWVQATGEHGGEIHRIDTDGEVAQLAGGGYQLQSAGLLDGQSAAVFIDVPSDRVRESTVRG